MVLLVLRTRLISSAWAVHMARVFSINDSGFLIGWIVSIDFNISMHPAAIFEISNGSLVSSTFIDSSISGCGFGGLLVKGTVA